jgi:hypothetical protein
VSALATYFTTRGRPCDMCGSTLFGYAVDEENHQFKARCWSCHDTDTYTESGPFPLHIADLSKHHREAWPTPEEIRTAREAWGNTDPEYWRGRP